MAAGKDWSNVFPYGLLNNTSLRRAIEESRQTKEQKGCEVVHGQKGFFHVLRYLSNRHIHLDFCCFFAFSLTAAAMNQPMNVPTSAPIQNPMETFPVAKPSPAPITAQTTRLTKTYNPNFLSFMISSFLRRSKVLKLLALFSNYINMIALPIKRLPCRWGSLFLSAWLGDTIQGLFLIQPPAE
jgi:hypothetical protein